VTVLHVDTEFYSPLSIKDYPLDVYASAPGSEILVAAYAFDDGPIRVWEKDQGPCQELRDGLTDPAVMVNAWHCNYERTVFASKGLRIPNERWIDTMVLARYAGLPGRLKDCAAVPMIAVPPEEKTKAEHALIRKFCMPGKEGEPETKADCPEDWALFVEYCRKDVLTMRHIYNWLLPRFPFPDRERQIWLRDQKINQRGLPVDVDLARAGASETARLIAAAQVELKKLTGLENPNSVQQIYPWLAERGYKYESLGKEFLKQSQADEMTDEGRQAIQVRLDAAKSSVKKFRTLVEQTSPDMRLRNQFVYGGAHTLRWSGRGFQPQNLTRKETDKETLNALLHLASQ
jgi:DNA polymerase bacteriophage-type